MPRNESLPLDLGEDREILTVSALNREVRRLIESGFGAIWVEGEISNLARPSSGHFYWSLKDAKAQVRCAMFRNSARALEFRPADGMQVLVRGRVSLYEPRGDYQLIVEQIEEAGEGALRRRFEALKRKLAAEGLFDPAQKRGLPAVPERIGVITSPTGAAIRDVLTSLKRRFPAARVLIYPTSVQGGKAAAEIVAALERASRRADCDLLILTRGGGSLEDLWPFNEESVARAVAAVRVPIIAAVGHETDFTIAEFAADLRAPTPSQAAELAVPEQAAFLERIAAVAEALERFLLRRLRDEQRKLDVLEHRLGRSHPGAMLRAKLERLRALMHRLGRVHPGTAVAAKQRDLLSAAEHLEQATRRAIAGLSGRCELVERALNALSPLATLERGYAIVRRHGDGTLVTRSSDVERGARIDVRLAAGALSATVETTTVPGGSAEPAGGAASASGKSSG